MSQKTKQKVLVSLVNHVYLQTNIAMGTSLFCASVVFLGLFSLLFNNADLYLWFGFYCAIMLIRLLLVYAYKQDKIAGEQRPYLCDGCAQYFAHGYLFGALFGHIGCQAE